jgi:hypothetical protein
MDKIKIGKKNYNVKYTIRALFLFEQITKKSFKIETLLDNYIFFYCMILANNPDNVLEWDDFVDALDKDPKLFEKINKVVMNQEKKNKLLDDGEKGEEKEDGKKN